MLRTLLFWLLAALLDSASDSFVGQWAALVESHFLFVDESFAHELDVLAGFQHWLVEVLYHPF